jgi:hypothetical protein
VIALLEREGQLVVGLLVEDVGRITGGARDGDRAGLAAVAETIRRDPGLMELAGDVDVRVDNGSVLAPAGLLATHGRSSAAAVLLRDIVD